MKKYRVVFDGIVYCVQRLSKSFFSRKPKWRFVLEDTYAGSYIKEYSTRDEAKAALLEIEKRNVFQFLEI